VTPCSRLLRLVRERRGHDFRDRTIDLYVNRPNIAAYPSEPKSASGSKDWTSQYLDTSTKALAMLPGPRDVPAQGMIFFRSELSKFRET
jgi:hypothetical protein